LNEHMCLPNLEQESDLPMSLSTDLAPCTNSLKDVSEDILVYVDLPTTPNDFCEFDVGEQSDPISELDTSITPEVEPHELDDSKAISQEFCDEITEPTILDFDGDILYVEYESFSCEFDVIEGLDLDFHVKYEAFSFDSIIPDLLFKLDDNILHIEYESFCGLDVNMSLNKNFHAKYESFSVYPVQADLLLEYCSSPFPSLLSSLDPPEFTFVEPETFVLDTPCLDQTLDDDGVDRLKDHFEIQDLILGRHLSTDFHISFDWPGFGPLLSPFRDVRFHLDHSDHFRWFMHSYRRISIKPLTCASDFTYAHLSSD